MFNQMGEDKRTESVPAILLLNENQQPWKSKARTAGHRIVVTMPLTMKQLRNSVEQLLHGGNEIRPQQNLTPDPLTASNAAL